MTLIRPLALLGWAFCLLLYGCAGFDPALAQSESPAHCMLDASGLSESSGLAAGRRNTGVLWTHNDSGHAPRLYAFTPNCRLSARLDVSGAEAVDWEDMAAFERDGRAYLVIADVGDNRHRRSQYDLYLVPEPDLSAEPKPKQAAVAGRIRFTYEDGRHNCEGLAVSPDGSTAWLVVKTMGLIANVYRMDLDWDAAEPLTARRVGQVETPTVTGLDLSPDGRRMFVLSYGDGYEYRRGEEETWDRALKRSPRAVALPRREQGEAAAYGLDGRTLYLTSEGRPMPLWILSR